MRRPLLLSKVCRGLYLLHTQSKGAISVETPSNPASIHCQKYFHSSCSLPSNFSKPFAICSSLELWHNRLGHLPFHKIKHLSLLNSSHNSESIFVCNICPRAIQHKLPFPHSQIHTTSIFELIHIDTSGPYHTATHEGYKYFLTTVDDYSRATWTYLLTTKKDASFALKNFIQMIETQSQTKIKQVRSDNLLN